MNWNKTIAYYTIIQLKQLWFKEIEKAWSMVDASHEKESRAKETIQSLKIEISNLTKLVEQGAGLSVGQENRLAYHCGFCINLLRHCAFFIIHLSRYCTRFYSLFAILYLFYSSFTILYFFIINMYIIPYIIFWVITSFYSFFANSNKLSCNLVNKPTVVNKSTVIPPNSKSKNN